MNNLDIFANTFSYFSPNWVNKLDREDNCSGNCPTEIVKRLPFWINNQPFWTYQCTCCDNYQFKEGQVAKGGLNE